MKKSIVLLPLFLCFISGLQATIIQRLGLAQGLSNDYVVGITQDSQGVMWFATHSGLNRFDGRQFTTFTSSDKKTINGNELNAVYTNPNGSKIWIATARNGFNMFDCKTYKFSSFVHQPTNPNSLSNNGVTDIKGASRGNLWIATYGGGIDYYDTQTQKFIHYNQSNVKGLASNLVWSVCDDHQGKLYIGHVLNGLSILSIKSRKAVNFTHNPKNPSSLPDNNVPVVFIDSYKNVWVGTANGLGLFNPNEGNFTVFRHIQGNENSISANFINCISETSDHKLLIGTLLGGLNILDLKQMFYSRSITKVKFEHVHAGNLNTELSSSFVKSIFHDSFGNIWIGTFGGGINFIPKNTPFFHTIQYSPIIGNKNSLSAGSVIGVCVDSNNSLWAATGGGGIDVYHHAQKIANYSKSNGQIKDNDILSAFTDSNGDLWFGTVEGQILRYHHRSGVFEYMTGFNTDRVNINSFFEDRDKNIWISTNYGIREYNLRTGKKTFYYTSNSGITDVNIRTISQDGSGNIWVGTLLGDICVFDKAFKLIRVITPDHNLYSINQLYCDSKGRMWVATGDKLYLFNKWDEKDPESFGRDQGLADNFIASVIEGNNGRIWCGTNSGISCINLQNNKIKNYNHYDGIPLGNFMLGDVAIASDGIIYFGSENGVCYFNSNSEPQDENIAPAVITDFAVSNVTDAYTGKLQYFPTTSPIQLKYDQNTFTIAFNVPDYAYNNQIEFSYMLKGLEDAWYNVKNTRQLTFRNLSPGSYTFLLKSRYKNQAWSTHVTTLPITITPPWWLSWWAESIYAFLGLVLLISFIRFYKHRLQLENSLYLEKQNNLQQQALNTERLKFYTNITHELRTPLTLIIGPLEDLINDQKLQEFYQGKIRYIYKSANRLLELINQILEFRKAETQNRKLKVQSADLSNQIREMSLKYEELNRNPKVVIKSQIEEGDFKLVYDKEVMNIILDNLISNALKYTPSGEIKIGLCHIIENGVDYTEIEVSDTGYGIDVEALPQIFDRYYQVKSKHQVPGSGIGLSIVKSLIELHEATINVESKLGAGTVFRIRLITNNSYPNAIHPEIKQPEIEDQNADSGSIMLVVEDNEDIRQYISETFAEEFDIISAENGSEGMELAFSKIPDIIISDVMMPVMDGFELCRKVKEDFRTSHIPFIMLTAKDTLQDKTEGYTIGADSYITKPFSGNLLRSRVFNLIESRKRISDHFDHSFKSSEDNEVADVIGPIDNEFIKKITAYVEEHISDENINVSDIADIVFMSNSTLYRKIKAITGLSTNELIRKIRLRNARILLSKGEYNISEVMYMVGFNSSTYFRKCFKDEFGASPSEYQKKNIR